MAVAFAFMAREKDGLLCQHSLWSVVFLCLSFIDDWDVLGFWPRVLCTIFKSEAVKYAAAIIHLLILMSLRSDFIT